MNQNNSPVKINHLAQIRAILSDLDTFSLWKSKTVSLWRAQLKLREDQAAKYALQLKKAA